MSKIYTKTGDKGETSLIGGQRVMKCCDRVEAYGTVDELNSHIGLLAEMTPGDPCYEKLYDVQNNLFIIQTLLAAEDTTGLPPLKEEAILSLESEIDLFSQTLPPLKSFVIPGGTLASAQCHVARTVCRRAERCIVRLSQENPVEEKISRYVNRLSDYLFVLSRHLVVSNGKEEKYWHC